MTDNCLSFSAGKHFPGICDFLADYCRNLGFLPLAFYIQRRSQPLERYGSKNLGISRFSEGQFGQGHDCSRHLVIGFGSFNVGHFLFHPD